MTKNQFIEAARRIHGNKYNYLDLDILKVNNEITIQCKKHGNFSQTANSHLTGRGCPKCASLTNRDFSPKHEDFPQGICDII